MAAPRSTSKASICRAWFGADPVACVPLAGGGFSGSQVFAVAHAGAAGGTRRFVLKSFSGGATVARAAWIHRLMRHLRAEGVTQVPEVIETPGGDTVVVDRDGTPWELVGLMPGVAVDPPTEQEAAAGLEALAELHVAAGRMPDAAVREGPSPGHLVRIQRSRRLLDEPWAGFRDRLRMAGPAKTGTEPSFSLEGGSLEAAIVVRLDAAVEIFSRAAGRRALELVAGARAASLRLQPVLRDVTAEHVLFGPDGVGAADGQCADGRPTGIVDYHAAGIDTPATDVARLLGSWRRPPDRRGLPVVDAWRGAIAAYERVRPLEDGERSVISLLHSTAVVLGLDNWFRWTLEERRR
ncbi:MAG: aminoglycoside phosphotransferase family protein, partial [Planctomycetia bacterium]|nr:aminoglycoside phosphotransferase family protein [Planctomycetia bacterium]